MKTSRKIMPLLLSVVLLLTAMPISAFLSSESLSDTINEVVSMLTEQSEDYQVKEEDGKYYLYDGDKITEKGLYTDGNDTYYVLDNGSLAYDETVFVYHTNDILPRAYYKFDSQCKLVKNDWLTTDDGRVYYIADGRHSSGVTKIDGNYYFFGINTCEMVSDTTIYVGENDCQIKQGAYYFDADGIMQNPVFEEGAVIEATATNVATINAFSDNMIIQRDEPFSVWGSADASSGTVVVEFAGESAVATVDAEGVWKATFEKTFAYSTEGRELKVYGADTELSFSDILVGDVYYVIGQSNVFFDMQTQIEDLTANGGSMKYDFDDSRNIRFYRNSNLYTSALTDIFAQGTTTEFFNVIVDYDWMTPGDVEANLSSYKATDHTHRAFSALGYMFAYNMSNNTDIPIGVIEIDAAGYPIISFAPNELAEKWGDDKLDTTTGTYYNYLRNGFVNQPTMKTRFGYNHLIHPLKHFSTAGIIWYQGESDLLNHRGIWGDDGKTFAYQFAELMTFFRNDFGDGTNDFPVYMIEFPANFNNSGANAYMPFGDVRCEQGRISELLSNFHLVNSADFFNDLDWYNSIHPYIKDKQAKRLADIVLANSYGIGDMNYVKGPQFSSVDYGSDGMSATVTFTNVGNGLEMFGDQLYGFEVCTALDGTIATWEPAASASINGTDKVTVSHSKAIYGIRYHGQSEAFYPGITGFPTFSVTLKNSEDIPASAFVDIKEQIK